MVIAEAWWIWLIVGPAIGLSLIWLVPAALAGLVFLLTLLAGGWELVRGAARVFGWPVGDTPSGFWRWVDSL